MSNHSGEHRGGEAAKETDWFLTTHWSVVLAAGQSTSAAVEALQSLCTQYWQPLYFYVRRRGHNSEEAEDLTQEFFARLLARNDLGEVDPRRGRFRAFLLAAMNHFLANEWRRASALKRGDGRPALHLDARLAESLYATDGSPADPEHSFDRRWAETSLERAIERLREEYHQAERAALFQTLHRFLSVPAQPGDYETLGASLGMSESAVAKAVERIRWRYRELVRHEIAQTVSTPEEVDDEMRYLLEILRRQPTAPQSPSPAEQA